MNAIEKRLYALFGLCVIAASPLLVRWNLPNSYWLQVRSIAVGDVAAGDAVVLSVDRVIAKPFRARWIVTTRNLTPSGFVVACIGRGENDYSPEAVLPRPLTLDYWTGTTCALAPGRYRVDALWTIDDWQGDREVRASSNLFNVR